MMSKDRPVSRGGVWEWCDMHDATIICIATHPNSRLVADGAESRDEAKSSADPSPPCTSGGRPAEAVCFDASEAVPIGLTPDTRGTLARRVGLGGSGGNADLPCRDDATPSSEHLDSVPVGAALPLGKPPSRVPSGS